MPTTKSPTCNDIASTVNTNQPTLQRIRIFDNHTTLPQTSTATTGMRQNSATTNHPGGAGVCNLLSAITNRT